MSKGLDILPEDVAPAMRTFTGNTVRLRQRLYDALVAAHGDAFLACSAAAAVSDVLGRSPDEDGVVLFWAVPQAGRPSVPVVDQNGQVRAQLGFPRGWRLTRDDVIAIARATETLTERELMATLELRNQRLLEIQEGLELSVRERTKELEAARIEAEEGARSKARFLANMSHEIRTPMNAIIGLADLTLRTPMRPQQQRQNVSRIHQAGTSLLGIINDILDFSKIEAGKLSLENRPFPLASVLTNVHTVLGQQAEDKDLRFEIDVAPETPSWLVGDGLRIGQILTNLAGNAIKFTETGTVGVHVDVAESHPDSDAIQVSFTIRDTGIGMDEERLDQLYQPFTQADLTTTRKFGGTGLGLTICRHLVQMMNGSIQAQSKVNEGTTFQVILPLRRISSGALNDLGLERLAQSRVLLIDDDPDFITTVVAMLQDHVAEVCAVQTAAEGMHLTQQRRGTSDAFTDFLVDWRLPDRSGLEVTEWLRETGAAHRWTRVLLLTAAPPEDWNPNTLPPSVDQLLRKPLDRASLLATLCAQVSARPETSIQEGLSGLRVLIAEDNATNAEIAQALITSWGASTEVVTNGLEACQLLEGTEEQAFDVVLMDLQMPVMDGFTAVARLRSQPQFDTLPIYALTAHALPEDLAQVMRSGMQGRVTKPIEPQILYETLSAVAGEPTPPPHAQPRTPRSSSTRVTPLLDWEDGLSRTGGNGALLRSLLSDFFERHELDAWIARFRTGANEELQRELHSVKGVAGNLGLTRLAKLTTVMEHELRSGTDLTDLAVPDWLTALSDTLAKLSDFLSEPTETVEPRMTGAVDASTASHVLEAIRQALQDADFGSETLVLQHADVFVAEWGQEAHAAILEHTRELQFDDALAVLDALPKPQDEAPPK